MLVILTTTEHTAKLRETLSHLPVQVGQVIQDFLGGRILYALVDSLRVLVKAEVIAVLYNLALGHQEALLGASTVALGAEIAPTAQDVGDVIVLFIWVALVVESVTVALHIVEPHIIGATRVSLGEYQNRGAHPGVGFENAGRHVDYGLKLLVFHQLATQLLVGLRVTAEQHAVRHDAGATHRPCGDAGRFVSYIFDIKRNIVDTFHVGYI